MRGTFRGQLSDTTSAKAEIGQTVTQWCESSTEECNMIRLMANAMQISQHHSKFEAFCLCCQ